MEEEKKYLLKKINQLIENKKEKLLNKLPNVHEIEDGIVIRFFTHWDNCEDNSTIKFKKITNFDNSDESVVFFFMPKDSYFDLKQRFYIGYLTCLNGKIEINFKNKTKSIEGYSKICVESDEVYGLAKENTYLIITSNKSNWSEKTKKHIELTHSV